MLRVLTLSTLFPDSSRPNFGIFVERQTLGLAALLGVDVEVIVPIGLPPGPLGWHPYFRDRAKLPETESWKGLNVHRPRFLHLPGWAARFDAASMARAVLPIARRMHVQRPFDVIDAEFSEAMYRFRRSRSPCSAR